MDDFLARTEAMIAKWHGVVATNAPARRLAADLAQTIAAFEAVRDQLRFEDEPSTFEAALIETMEPPAPEPPAPESPPGESGR